MEIRSITQRLEKLGYNYVDLRKLLFTESLDIISQASVLATDSEGKKVRMNTNQAKVCKCGTAMKHSYLSANGEEELCYHCNLVEQ